MDDDLLQTPNDKSQSFSHLLFRWFIASLLMFVVGCVTLFIMTMFLSNLDQPKVQLDKVYQEVKSYLLLMVIPVAPAFIMAFMGTFLLKNDLSGEHRIEWVFLTVVGVILGINITYFLIDYMPNWPNDLIPVMVGGAVIGTAQFLELRRKSRYASLWIIISIFVLTVLTQLLFWLGDRLS